MRISPVDMTLEEFLAAMTAERVTITAFYDELLAGIETLPGLVLGLAASLALSRLRSNMIYGIETTDAGTLAGVSALVLLAAILASLVPAWRATKVGPIEALQLR